MAADAKQFSKYNTWFQPPLETSQRNREAFLHVQTADTVAAQSAAGYFNGQRELLQVGDLVTVIGSDGHRILLVATVPTDGTNVTVTNKAAA